MTPSALPPVIDHRPRWVNGTGDLAISALCLPGLVLHELWGGLHLQTMQWLLWLSPVWLLAAMRGTHDWRMQPEEWGDWLVVKLVQPLWLLAAFGFGAAFAWILQKPMLPLLLAAGLVLAHVFWPQVQRPDLTRRWQRVHDASLTAGAAFIAGLASLAVWILWSWLPADPLVAPPRPEISALAASLYFLLSGVGRGLWSPSWGLAEHDRRRA